jgi:hypothetical protein
MKIRDDEEFTLAAEGRAAGDYHFSAWSSDDPSVATVAANDPQPSLLIIRGEAAGETVIRWEPADALGCDHMTITVVAPPRARFFDKDDTS